MLSLLMLQSRCICINYCALKSSFALPVLQSATRQLEGMSAPDAENGRKMPEPPHRYLKVFLVIVFSNFRVDEKFSG
jgi:hypothetical protein